ncbi:MAG TPA: hypothetical protein VFJ67_09115 [Thermodesulfobacteriota bacterium]|jgi:hypothetical protein|nr:hypothetical protein [Thermodesulfobacteriota bacterium]
MTKILLIVLIVLIAFWLGKMSADGKRKNLSKRNSEPEGPVIDIKAEDK